MRVSSPEELQPQDRDLSRYSANHPEMAQAQAGAEGANTTLPPRPPAGVKVARNAACPCGSGKKYKHCHGRI